MDCDTRHGRGRFNGDAVQWFEPDVEVFQTDVDSKPLKRLAWL